MSFAASYSTKPDLSAALNGVCEEIAADLNGASPDLSFLFVSHAHADSFERLASRIREQIGTRVLLGCTGDTIVGGSEEIESGPATGRRTRPTLTNAQRR